MGLSVQRIDPARLTGQRQMEEAERTPRRANFHDSFSLHRAPADIYFESYFAYLKSVNNDECGTEQAVIVKKLKFGSAFEHSSKVGYSRGNAPCNS